MDWLFAYARPDIDWNYAMITLAVRFIGVFVVMLAMQVALQVAARVVRWVEAEPVAIPAATGTAAAVAGLTQAGVTAEVDGATAAAITMALQGADEHTAAAIGVALALESRSRTTVDPREGTSSWAAAGRLQQLNRLTR